MILGIQGVLNPPQKLAEGEKMPEPAGKKAIKKLWQM